MPSTVPAADTGLPKSNRADDAAMDQYHLINDANLLRHLIDVADGLLLEHDFGDEERELQRIAGLVRVGRDLAEQLSVDVAAIFQPKEMKPGMR
jgi:hypothetical protein